MHGAIDTCYRVKHCVTKIVRVEWVEVRIPIYSGHLFRREAGRRYDLMSATIPE